MGRERIEWVDISKGIGIILVIVGHCVHFGHFVHNWIFSFHMQLFFILSGMFFLQTNMTKCFKKRFFELIVPYIVFCIIGLVSSLLIPQWSFTYRDIIIDIYCGYPNAVNVSSIWFLICLFIVTLLFNFVLIVKKNNNTFGWVVFGVIISFGFLLGRFPHILASFPVSRMPFDSDCAYVALLFFALGYFFRDTILWGGGEKLSNNLSICLIGSIVSLILTVIVVILNGTVNLHGITYHNELIYICGAITGFSLVFFLSLILEKQKILKVCLMWFGRNSLKIMGVQAIVVRLYLLVVNNTSGCSYDLYFLPPLYAVLGCFVVTIISAGIVVLYNIVKKHYDIFLEIH